MSHASTPPPGTAPSAIDLPTYLVLMLISCAFALLAAPQVLASLGLLSHTSLQGWITLLAMWLGLPLILLVPIAAILSLIGLVRGPMPFRLRLAGWWAVGAGGGSLALALAQTPSFNPYLGTPQPAFGLGDALLVVCLSLCVFWSSRWFSIRRRESRVA